MNSARLFLLTLVTMIAFASNSLLCRAALKQTSIDPGAFTLVRIVSGTAALWLITKMRRVSPGNTGNWPSALALFAYAAAFSFAYVDLSAGTGALLLFGAVQATMILWGLFKGERLDILQIAGLVLALSGLVLLVLPGFSSPPFLGSILMLTAGMAWGIYSLRGKGARDAIAVTAGNFVRAVPFAMAICVVTLRSVQLDRIGIVYGIISGAITSGLGYAIWYSVLSDSRPVRLGPTSAATVQLSVPVLAAAGGILLLGEPITFRYVLASMAILGGIALVILKRTRAHSSK